MSLEQLVDKHYNRRLPNMRRRLRESARNKHRYKNQTGWLTRSTGTKHNKRRRSIRVIAKASYDVYVTEGHGTWRGDNWKSNAVRRNRKWLKEQYESAVNDAVREYNKQRGNSGRNVYNGV